MDENKEILNDLAVECTEQLDAVLADVLELEEQSDEETINRIFRVFHSVKGNISMMGYMNCCAFAHKVEDLVSLIREGELGIDSTVVNIVLRSLDTLKLLLEDIRVRGCDDRDISDIVADVQRCTPTSLLEPSHRDRQKMLQLQAEMQKGVESKKLRILIVEDNFANRFLMQKMLSPYGDVFIAVNGNEAIEAFLDSLDERKWYDLICLDILMPEKDGHTALKEIRGIEKSNGILPGNGVKIIMTTSLTSPKDVMQSFDEMCNGYLFKPIEKVKLLALLKKLNMLNQL